MTNNTAALRNDTHDSSTRKEVIEKSIPLVKSITARLRLSHGHGASFDELYERGIDGLMQAAERFDPSRGVAFTTFAYYRVRGAILDSLRRGPERQRLDLSREEAIVTVQAAGHVLAANDNGRREDHVETSTDQLSWQLSEPVFAQLIRPDDIGALPDESALHPDEEIERHRLAERVAAAISALPEIERRVVELHYYEDMSYAEIGQELGICKPWAFRLHNKALRQLRETLAEVADSDDSASDA